MARGAVWLAPAAVLTISAPAVAASVQECPTLAAPNTWAGPTYPSGAPQVGYTRSYSTSFRNTAERTSTAYYAQFTTTLEVQAGWSYVMSSVWQYTYGNNNAGQSVISRFDILVDDELVIRRYTRQVSGEVTPPAPGTNATATETYTATASGPVEVRVLFVVAAPSTQTPSGDDITVYAPTVDDCFEGPSV